jgi:hypothetical protein
MIGKKMSENQPIAEDETREEVKSSANGTIRQEMLDELWNVQGTCSNS